MGEIDKLVDICLDYKLNKFSIEEFQARIEEVLLPYECKDTLGVDQYNSGEKLELAIHAYAEPKKSKSGIQVADLLILECLLEKKRLENNKPYMEEKLRA